ncbi:hypothetical protein GGI12_003917 [Dipsacomyces acuminosporus]|nr:hypothetical protein GGI12_003917 [Dipsacomyces acuminosporus]
MAALQAIAAQHGIPPSVSAQLTPKQLEAFLQQLQAQHQMRLRQAPDASAVGPSTPQRHQSTTPISAAAQNAEQSRPSSVRPSKGVARDRSKSRSPAPNSHSSQPQSSPRSLGHPSVQRKGSAASMFAEDIRSTPTPSEASASASAPPAVFTPEEIASAQKTSEEFLKRLPTFTSESFMAFLVQFLKDNSITGNFSKPPAFDDKQIDLYRFFTEVIKQGGLEQVHTRRIWRQVAKDSGLPDIPTLPPLLSRWYKVWLQPLEQLAVFPPGHPKHTGVNANFSLKKRRKQDAFGSPGSTPGPAERSFSVNPDSNKRPKMYSPLTNGVASATASPAHFTPPPPMPATIQNPAAAGAVSTATVIATPTPVNGGIIGDDMQDETAVRGLLLGGDDLWSFTSDRTLTLVYALRNLCFLPANQQYLANNADFARTFVHLVSLCEEAVGAMVSSESSTTEPDRLASLVVLRALEFRKSLIVILASVSHAIELKQTSKGIVQAALRLICYFIDDMQTSDIADEWIRDCMPLVPGDPLAAAIHVRTSDGRVYYLHALEAASRLTISDNNQKQLASLADPELYSPLATACAALLTGHQMAAAAYPASPHNYSEQRLMWLQMSLMVLSNFVAAATPQPLVASRKYTQFRIPANGVIGPAAGIGGSLGTSTVRRAMGKRPMPFVPVVYTSMLVPASVKEFRQLLASNTGLVRSLLEIVLFWWNQIGLPCSRSHTQQVVDSPFSDMAERSVYILQLLHPEHDAMFASRWRDWVIEQAARSQMPPVLAEVLYELVGMIPVQSTAAAAAAAATTTTTSA